MNMKENILFLRNEWKPTGDVDKTDRTDLGKCIHLYDEKQGNKQKTTTKQNKKQTNKKQQKQTNKQTKTHKRFRQKIVFVRCKKTDNNK